ncbi:hypothetical protein COXBURSA331_A0285 [Coxiella burnetii RSA 331]|nr:hypothetical protein COXBURSA331_A0285 [Coxiella burnetii RSA 331]
MSHKVTNALFSKIRRISLFQELTKEELAFF